MKARAILAAIGLVLMAALPLVGSDYILHIGIQILLWAFVYTAWSMMGRFGLTSFGHGAFLGIGAYVPALLWNFYGVTPWLGIPASMALSIVLGMLIGYPSFRLRVVGHYFALVTLALSQVVLLSLVAARDITGGSLGMTLNLVHSWLALQFTGKATFYLISLVVWVVGLAIWHWIDSGIGRVALEAISEDEIAAASSGINVMREKLRVTVISAALTALGGALLTQYIQYVNPEVVSGVSVSLQIVFAAIAGGMHTLLGPTVGSFFTIALNESLRVVFGTHFIGAANTIYGILLILFIVFMPQGIVGLIEGVSARAVRGRRQRTPAGAPAAGA
jgi:branched-chain amino acid transport system permease protein